jgi:hypothetical protein
MIDDKKIEEAARRYSEVTDCDKEEALLIEEGFKEGAKWAINEFLKDLWHDTIEEPKEKVPLLYYRKHKILPFMVDKNSDVYDWNTLVYNFDITKWLYIEDLFPKEGGENG